VHRRIPYPRASRCLLQRSSIVHEASLRGAIVQGLGLAVLPLYLVATDLQEGRLVEVRSEAPPVADQIYAMYMRGRRHR